MAEAVLSASTSTSKPSGSSAPTQKTVNEENVRTAAKKS